jgi:hypothetical protein
MRYAISTHWRTRPPAREILLYLGNVAAVFAAGILVSLAAQLQLGLG